MLHSRMLRYLDEVARSGSIRKAAERLNVSSSSVNRQIIALEDEMGVPIFHRLPYGMRLTLTGEMLLAHVRSTLKEHDRLQIHLRQVRGIQGGEVRILAMAGLVGGLLPEVLSRFAADHPRVEISLKTMLRDQISDALLAGEADIGLGYNLPETPGTTITGRFVVRLGAVVASGHLLTRSPTVTLEQILEFPTVVGDRSMTINKIVMDAFREEGIDFRPTFLSNSSEFMRSMAISQNAVTFLSRIDVSAPDRSSPLVYIPIKSDRLRNHELVLMRRTKGPVDNAVDILDEEIKRACERTTSDTPVT